MSLKLFLNSLHLLILDSLRLSVNLNQPLIVNRLPHIYSASQTYDYRTSTELRTALLNALYKSEIPWIHKAKGYPFRSKVLITMRFTMAIFSVLKIAARHLEKPFSLQHKIFHC